MNKMLVYWVSAVMVVVNAVIFSALMYAIFGLATNLAVQIIFAGASILNLSLIAGHVWFAIMFDEEKGVFG